MQLFDLHCDTLYKAYTEKGSVVHNDYHFSFEKALQYDSYTQVMAVWIPDECRGETAVNLAEKCAAFLKKQMNSSCGFNQANSFNELENHSHNVVLSIEGGAALNGRLENIKRFRKLGVRFLTLTWNGANEIGDGILCKNPKGLTEFGKAAVAELEKNGIIIDVSHASVPLFWQTAELAKRPFVATHSNARAVCKNPRNLDDEQFKHICKIGGIVGINFHRFFVTDSGTADFSDLHRHIEYFLSLGGENVLALGSDYDGAEMPPCIKGVQSMGEFYNYLLRHNYSEDIIRKIFYTNAYNFCKNFDI